MPAKLTFDTLLMWRLVGFLLYYHIIDISFFYRGEVELDLLLIRGSRQGWEGSRPNLQQKYTVCYFSSSTYFTEGVKWFISSKTIIFIQIIQFEVVPFVVQLKEEAIAITCD